MYRFIRSIYRELAPQVIEDEQDPTGCANRLSGLDRMRERRSPPEHRPPLLRAPGARIQRGAVHFAIGDQLRVWNVIESNISLALDLLERAPELLELDGVPHECRAHARKGHPLPARAVARTRLLPLAQAPRGRPSRRPRSGSPATTTNS